MLSRTLLSRSERKYVWGQNAPVIEGDVEFFSTVRAVMLLFCSGQRTAWLRHHIDQYVDFNVRISVEGRYDAQFECLRTNDLHQVFAMTRVLFRGWPWMFVGHCAEARIWKSLALKDLDQKKIPSLVDIVQTYLFDPYRFRIE